MSQLSKKEQKAADLAFTKDPAFTQLVYSSYQLLGTEMMLSLLENVPAKSAPAYQIARTLTEKKEKFFECPEFFPLQPAILKTKKNVDQYIARLAALDEQTAVDYLTQYKTLEVEKRLAVPYPSAASTSKIKKGASEYDWKFLKAHFQMIMDELIEYGKLKKNNVLENIEKLSKTLGLDETDKKVFKVVLAYGCDPNFGDFLDDVVAEQDAFHNLCARALGMDKKDFKKRLGQTGKLFQKSIISIDEKEVFPHPSPFIDQLLEDTDCTEADLIQVMVGEEKTTSLLKEDYAHLQDIDFVIATIKDAQKNGTKGINFLFWSDESGTGKTELSAVIAAETGTKLYMPREKDPLTHAPFTRAQRFQALHMAQSVFQGRNDVVLMFDEMEDLLPNAESESPNSKAYFNHLMENNPVPIIWTANSIAKFDSALLRRFTGNIHVSLPTASVRIRMYETIAKRLNRTIAMEDAEELGKKYIVTPAYIQKAIEADGVQNKNPQVIKENLIRSIENSAFLHTNSRRGFTAQGTARSKYNYDLTNVKISNMPFDLEELTKKLKGTKVGVSFVVHGPDGTGKTTLARQLCHDVLERETLEYTLGELITSNSNDTQKNILNAYEIALHENKALIIKGSEELLAYHSIDTKGIYTPVIHELMGQCTDTKVPLFVTAASSKQTDPDTLNKFMFAMKLDHLKPEQVEKCYKTFFNRDFPGDGDIVNIPLATGDFARVAKVFHAFQQNMSDKEILTVLRQQAERKRDGIPGFRNTHLH